LLSASKLKALEPRPAARVLHGGCCHADPYTPEELAKAAARKAALDKTPAVG